MKHAVPLALCAWAFLAASAGPVDARHLRDRAVLVVTPLPLLEGRSVYAPDPTPADFACTPYTCRPGGRRIPGVNPEGDVFEDGVP